MNIKVLLELKDQIDNINESFLVLKSQFESIIEEVNTILLEELEDSDEDVEDIVRDIIENDSLDPANSDSTEKRTVIVVCRCGTVSTLDVAGPKKVPVWFCSECISKMPRK